MRDAPGGAHARDTHEGSRARCGAYKRVALDDAIQSFVEPGMHLNFASTPSRSNASVIAVARAFRGTEPRFELSSTGFHSALHLLAALRLGRRYIGCFFGDNYPTPRPNALYRTLEREGHDVEHWSLWSYVSALSAAAFGHRYAFTRSLLGTTLASDLATRDKYFEIPDPAATDQRLGLVSALTPDVTFLHAPAGDAEGRVAFSPPHGEGFAGALAARRGVIVTVERMVSSDALRHCAHLMPLPAHRVLAVCEAPRGAHPQPLHVAPRELPVESYDDDTHAYLRWRDVATNAALLRDFEQRVLEASSDWQSACTKWFAPPPLVQSKGSRAPSSDQQEPSIHRTRAEGGATTRELELEPGDRLVLLGGRTVARRLQGAGHRALLAGIGQAFAAARFAKLTLAAAASEVELMIETGFSDFDPACADSFLLSRSNIAAARRLTSVDNMLGALCCGGATACLGVIGAAQVDALGNVNSTRARGELIVGAGGATDIAGSAREVVVLVTAEARRLVNRVEYVTSVGRNVRAIATDLCVFERDSCEAPWVVRDVVPAAGRTLLASLQASGFNFVESDSSHVAEPPSEMELSILSQLKANPGCTRAEAAHD